MKLLFDQSLSPRLVDKLEDLFPESDHVFNIGIDQSPDYQVRDFARLHSFMIVTKDSDFEELNILMGFPPKVIWIRRGNSSTQEIENLLRNSYEAIQDHDANPQSGTLVLY